MALEIIKKLGALLFGDFEREELKKFLLLGLIFGLIMGIVWTLRPMKDLFFQNIVGNGYKARAHLLSLLGILPLILISSKLVDLLPHRVLFSIVSIIYSVATIIISLFMLNPRIGLANASADPSRILGWAWYFLVDSFALFIITLFWAFAIDTAQPPSAKRGFSLIVLIGTLGGMLFPFFLTSIPRIYTIHNAYLILIMGLLMLLIALMVWLLNSAVSAKEMAGYKGEEHEVHEDNRASGPFGGLRLLFSNSYLWGILAIMVFHNLIMEAARLNFMSLINTEAPTKMAKIFYLTDYAAFAQYATLFLLLIGWRIGLTASLTLLPLILAGVVASFAFSPTLSSLFWLMVVARATDAAIQFPSMKQIYIPTSRDAQYKSQLWINALAPLGASLTPLASNVLVLAGILVLWIVLALYLGRTYSLAVDENRSTS